MVRLFSSRAVALVTGNPGQPASWAGGLTHALRPASSRHRPPRGKQTFGCRGTLSWREELVSAATSGKPGAMCSRTRGAQNPLATVASG